jgi:hypothetical protein
METRDSAGRGPSVDRSSGYPQTLRSQLRLPPPLPTGRPAFLNAQAPALGGGRPDRTSLRSGLRRRRSPDSDGDGLRQDACRRCAAWLQGCFRWLSWCLKDVAARKTASGTAPLESSIQAQDCPRNSTLTSQTRPLRRRTPAARSPVQAVSNEAAGRGRQYAELTNKVRDVSEVAEPRDVQRAG